MHALLRDLQFAARQLRRHPAFTLAVLLTLALGTGSATAVFSIVNAVLVRPLAFPDPGLLMSISTLGYPPGVSGADPSASVAHDTSYLNFQDWQRLNHTFSSIAAYRTVPRLFAHSDGSAGRVINQTTTSASLFHTLGVSPLLGRPFEPVEDQPGARVAMLSHELWVSDFAASPTAIGSVIRISDQPLTVVGILPIDFQFPVVDLGLVFTPAGFDPEAMVDPRHVHQVRQRGSADFSIVGRLRPHTSPAAAQADLDAIQRALASHYAENRFDPGASVVPQLEDSVGYLRSPFLLLSAAVAALLLIACANGAALLLTRAAQRQTEIAVRAALGATRRQLLRQLLIESALVALAASTLSIFLAEALLRVALVTLPGNLPRLSSIAINGRVLAFALLLAAATALLFGLLPAWRGATQSNTSSALRAHPSTPDRRRHRLQSALLVVQVALSLVLVLGAALLMQSFVHVLDIDPGIETAHTLDFGVALTASRYSNEARVGYFHQLLPRLAALPGVHAVSAAYPVPLRWHSNTVPVFVPGQSATDHLPEATPAAVEPGYFETLEIPVLLGRTFRSSDDDPLATPVAIVNQAFVHRYLPSVLNPVGLHITPDLGKAAGPRVSRQIIAVVSDTRSEDALLPPTPQMYFPYAQASSLQRPEVQMRVSGDPATYRHTIETVARQLDPAAPIFSFLTFRDLAQRNAAQQRFNALLISAFAASAFALAMIGLYSSLSFTVLDRTREIAIRIALGSRRSQVLALILGRGLALSASGLALGLLVWLLTAALLAGLLYHVAPRDPRILLLSAAATLAVAACAAALPALRAVRLQPTRILRDQ